MTFRYRGVGKAGRGRHRWMTAAVAVLAVGGVGAVGVALADQRASPPAPAPLAAVTSTSATPTPMTAAPTPRRSSSSTPSADPAAPPAMSTNGHEHGGAASRASGSAAGTLPRSRPVRVDIPAMHVSAPVVSLGLTSSGALEVPHGPDPVGWFDGSPTPGQRGPSILAGHVTWNSSAGAFLRLSTLSEGDRIVVHRADGTAPSFVVTRLQEYAKDAFPTWDVYGNTAGAELRLITCAGDYERGAPRPYPDNLVVYARLAAHG